MYGCESRTIRKAECQRIDTFELWYWRRLFRVPWTARRTNQSILKEISPEHLLEGLMLLSIISASCHSKLAILENGPFLSFYFLYPQTAISFSFVFCVKTLAWISAHRSMQVGSSVSVQAAQLSCWGPPKYGWMEMWVAPCL